MVTLTEDWDDGRRGSRGGRGGIRFDH
jgi:hypothetical protein